MDLLERLSVSEGSEAHAPIEHLARRGMKWMPERDGKAGGMLDRVSCHVLDCTIARQSRDVLAGRLEAPDQAAREIGNERMLKVSCPPQIKCNSAVGQIEALDPRALTRKRAFDLLLEPARGRNGLGSGVLERLGYGSSLSAVGAGPAQLHVARAGHANNRHAVTDRQAPLAIK